MLGWVGVSMLQQEFPVLYLNVMYDILPLNHSMKTATHSLGLLVHNVPPPIFSGDCVLATDQSPSSPYTAHGSYTLTKEMLNQSGASMLTGLHSKVLVE